METIDLVYSELKSVKKEVSELRKELVNFKIKVIIYAAVVSTSTGIAAKFIPMMG